jgi:hypothetical protein
VNKKQHETKKQDRQTLAAVESASEGGTGSAAPALKEGSLRTQ